ncbi:hypothetical protein [Enterococcus caccae]|uniref:hypothetical protein n=1 Tax=Enterococcus caccae TaxID=317735 RepID=UPI0003A9586F|nr:hypothetical protein [Enterococcus caccae]OJG26942.1 hypothetical protein RU98_GL003033 [Enterococcus caccae]
MIGPSKVEHGEEETKKELMKDSWILLETEEGGKVDQKTEYGFVHMCTEQNRKIITSNKRTDKVLKEFKRETGKNCHQVKTQVLSDIQ